ncbi:MAG: transketolase [Spirochaetaceae bacterium]|nr:transketolase [Myxococcales bacterium]MCB9724619.1 transketolase [Spirochaetaceae bacterium]
MSAQKPPASPAAASPELLGRIENTIRFLAVDAIERAGIGHVGAPMALAAAAFELWDNHLRFDPRDPAWPLRDRFVLSNGHASMLQYALLHLFGFDLSLDDIARFRQLGSRTPGHPEYGETPGVELTTGPLGAGFAHGVGMALAARMTRSQFGGQVASGGADRDRPGAHFVYGFVGDGDLMEGVASEAASFAGAHALGNLIYVYDDNQITIDGGTAITFSESVPARFAAYGWHVVDSVDGQDRAGLARALEAARAETERPSLIVLKTLIGRGAPNFEGRNKAHGGPLGAEETRLAKERAGWPTEPDLIVPEDVRAYCAARGAAKHAERLASDAALATWRGANAEAGARWDAARGRTLPSDLVPQLIEGLAGVANPTRKHSAVVLDKLASLVPYMAGGSADLAGSAAPPIVKAAGIVGPAAGDGADAFAGRNIHFGVREHAMGAIANGIALDGTFLAYCGTFLIFSDYMRPAIRLAALMKTKTLFVFTHDSIFVGEDGPTHQPVEQIDSLRVLPGLTVFRPADGVETAMAYAWYLQQSRGPVLLSLTRQTVPAIERPAGFDPETVWRGAYVVSEPEGKPHVVIVATGSEVGISIEAAKRLAADGIRARVVSMPSVELFLELPDAEQDAVVPDDGTPVVAVEAGRGETLRRFVGRRGLVIGMERFGASAPYQALAEHYGFTAEQVARRVKALV